MLNSARVVLGFAINGVGARVLPRELSFPAVLMKIFGGLKGVVLANHTHTHTHTHINISVHSLGTLVRFGECLTAAHSGRSGAHQS